MNGSAVTAPDSPGHAHPAHVAHHFDSAEQQYETGKLGMWTFLLTEILIFGGLFAVYAVYRSNHPEVFQFASQYLNTYLGALNTAVLLVSSFTAAWAVRCAQLGSRRGLILNLIVTIVCAFAFLGIKYNEYSHKYHEGLLWGSAQHSIYKKDHNDVLPEMRVESEAYPEAAELHPEFREEVGIFFAIYFCLTGLHGIHVLIGILLLSWLLFRALRGDFGPDDYNAVDFGVLYWHLVDIIWIFLFPLLYLIG